MLVSSLDAEALEAGFGMELRLVATMDGEGGESGLRGRSNGWSGHQDPLITGAGPLCLLPIDFQRRS